MAACRVRNTFPSLHPVVVLNVLKVSDPLVGCVGLFLSFLQWLMMPPSRVVKRSSTISFTGRRKRLVDHIEKFGFLTMAPCP